MNFYLLSINEKESILFKVFNKLLLNWPRTIRLRHGYDKRKMLRIRDYLECEAHRELFITGILDVLKKNG